MLSLLSVKNNSMTIGLNFLLASISAIYDTSNTISTFNLFPGI